MCENGFFHSESPGGNVKTTFFMRISTLPSQCRMVPCRPLVLGLSLSRGVRGRCHCHSLRVPALQLLALRTQNSNKLQGNEIGLKKKLSVSSELFSAPIKHLITLPHDSHQLIASSFSASVISLKVRLPLWVLLATERLRLP